MPKVLVNGKEFELPLKIIFEDKEYWIKRATKTTGIFLNSINPNERQKREEC